MNHDLTTHAGQISHYAAVRARINSAKYTPVKVQIVENRWPEWKRKATYFDWHVITFKIESKTAPHIKWLKKRCRDFGVHFRDIKGDRGSPQLTIIRMRLYWEMKKEFPKMTFLEIGFAFGGRDHSSVHHGIKRWEAMRHESALNE